jgi:hypothetical protein
MAKLGTVTFFRCEVLGIFEKGWRKKVTVPNFAIWISF